MESLISSPINSLDMKKLIIYNNSIRLKYLKKIKKNYIDNKKVYLFILMGETNARESFNT
ncbi:Uncharacterised protein [Sphingobacterium daejeonense]|nr:Uncharacterised protein [Sphingobacterium daejeonense]